MKLSAILCCLRQSLAILLVFCLSLPLSAQLAPGDVMIVAIVTDSNSGPLAADANCGDGFAFVALVPIPANEVILFSEDEYVAGSFNTGEGALSWTNGASVLTAGTVVRVTTNASTSANCPTPSASTGAVAFVGGDPWELATSNEEIYVFQGTLGSPTMISALFTDLDVNTPPASINGFVVNFTATDADADLGIYTGGLSFPSKAAAAAAIVDVANNWTLEDGGETECCDADGVDYPADIPPMFTIGSGCVDPTIALTQNPQGPHCPTASVNIVINGGTNPAMTSYTLRTGSAAGPIVSGPVVTTQFTINSIQATTTYFVTAPNCAGGTVSQPITITTTGTVAMAGPDQLNLMGTSTFLAGSNPSPGTGVWTETSGDGNGIFGSASSPTSTFSGTPGVTYTLQWVVTNAPCATTSDEVMVSFSAASTLAIGDMAFTGYQSDNPDTFSFVIFTDIGTGTVINFTDNGWLSTGAFRTGEGIIAVTFNGMALCGDQFFVTGGNFLNADGTSAGTVTNISGSLDLAISGDQLFAYQGSLGSPTLLTGIQMNGPWDTDATNTNTSAQPQVFIDNPGTSLAISPEVDNAVFDCSNLPVSSSISGNRAAVNTPANWEVTDEATTGIPPVDCIADFSCCEDPVITNLTYSPDPVCPGAGNNITLTITGSLNDATEWVVYNSSCGGTEVLRSSNAVINLGSLATVGITTIFVRGEGGCVPAGGNCTSLDIMVEETVTALCVAPFTVQLDSAGMATITAADVDNGSSACTTPTLSINEDTFDCTNIGSNVVTLTVEGQNNNTATCTVTITIADSRAPQALCQDIEVFLDANGMASIVPADVDNGSNDNCGVDSLAVTPNTFDCNDIGNSNVVTLSVFDAAGNFVSCMSQVTVRDTIRPVFTCQDITVSLNASGMFSIPSANFIRDNIQTNFQDNCANSSGTFGITVDSWNCSNIGPNSTTVFARDGNGNETPCTITVTVTDPLMTCNQPPVATCQPVIVNADANCEATTVTAEDFDGGSTDADMDPLTFSVSPVGPYTLGITPVILTVSDGSLMSQCMTTVTVNDVTPPVVTCPATQTVQADPMGDYTLVDFTGLANVDDNCTTPPTVTQSPMVGSTLGVGSHTITLIATDASSNADTCDFTLAVQALISGQVVWEHDGITPVSDIPVTLSGDDTGTDGTDINGDYSFSTTGGDLTVTPNESGDPRQGVDAGDVTRIRQHVLNTLPFTSPYKRIAADVNQSNTITNADAAIIQQALLNNVTAGIILDDPAWRFVDAAYTFPNPSAPWSFPSFIDLMDVDADVPDVDFIGVKIGDVNGTWAQDANLTGQPAAWRVVDEWMEAGSSQRVSFSVSESLPDVAAWQFALRFDPAYVTVSRVLPSTALPLTREDFGTHQLMNGELRSVFAMAEGQPLKAGEIAFELELNVRRGGVRLSDVMKLDNSILDGRVYNTKLEGGPVKLAFEPARDKPAFPNVPAHADAALFELYQNVPNPFADETIIAFSLPMDAAAVITIQDASGRVVAQLTGDYAAGYNSVQLTREALKGASGVLSYTVTAGAYTATRRMVLVR